MTENKMPKRIYGYCRESTKEQAINGYNIDDQEKKIRKYVELYYSENDDLKIYRDEGASAKNVDRPKMKQIIKLIKQNEVDVLIVHNLDRLTRRVKDLGIMLELFQAHNIQLVSITEKIDTTTSMGRFFIYLIVLIAQWEQDTIAERTKRGLEEGAIQGNYTRGGRAPFGYSYNKNTKKLVINEKVAPDIRELFQKIASGDYSQQGIAYEFSSKKLGGKKKWTQGDIARILNNRIYYGCFETSTGKLIENHQPAIVSKDSWLACAEVLRGGALQKHAYVFKNYIYCKQCGTKCAQSTTKKHKVYKYYVCECCGGRMNEDRIMLLTKDQITNIGTRVPTEDKINQYKIEYQRCISNMNALTAAYKTGAIGVDYYTEIIVTEETKVREIANAITSLKGETKFSFATMPYNEERKILKQYIEKIEVDFKSKIVSSIVQKNSDMKNSEQDIHRINRESAQ